MARACILGCAGARLTAEERDFFAGASPFGFILFARNIEAPGQVRALVAELREACGRPDAPVLVDQEGGRVQRFGPPFWPRYPAARRYRDAAGGDPVRAQGLARLGGRLLGGDLQALGVNVACAPVLDVPEAGADPIIGDRAFSEDADEVARLARAFADGLIAARVLPVVKHAPGHGRASGDSHHMLPVVTADLEALERDFRPFRALSDLPFAMTAHIVYAAIDPERPATTSPSVIRLIRDDLGFSGLLMSDDLSMAALEGPLEARAEAALGAGCDLVLHCNGDLEEMAAVAAAAPVLDARTDARARLALERAPKTAEPGAEGAAAAFFAAFEGR